MIQRVLRHVDLPRAMQAYQLLRMGTVLASGIILTKMALPLADLGQYETLLYLGSLVVFWGVNGFLQAIGPVSAHLETKRGAVYSAAALLFSLLAAGIVAVLALAWGMGLSFMQSVGHLPYVVFFGWWLFFQTAALPVEMFYLSLNRPWELLGWGVVGVVLQMGALLVPLWTGYGFYGSWLCLAAVAAMRFGWMLWLLYKHGSMFGLKDALGALWRFGSPLVLNSVTGNAILLFDGWLVAHYYQDDAIFAVYRYGSREFPLALALSTALGTALVPQLVTQWSAGLSALRHRGLRLMHGLYPMAIVLLWTITWWFPRVFNTDLTTAIPLFKIYLLLTATRVLLPNTVLMGLQKPNIVAKVAVLELLIKIVSGVVGLHYGGLIGLCWSAVVSFAFEKIALIWYLEKRARVSTQRWLALEWYMGYTLLLIGTYLLTL